MNPYEVSHISSDAIQSLLDTANSLSSSPEIIRDRLQQLQQVQSKSWHLLRHNEHADFIMARLESMDVLCGRMLPLMDAARKVSTRRRLAQLKKSTSFRLQTSKYLRLPRSKSSCISFPKDELAEIVAAISEELRIWLDYQDGIYELLSCQAFGVFPRLQTLALEGYHPVPGLLKRIVDFLSQKTSQAIVVSGPSGIGKSSLATYVASNIPEFLSDGPAEVHFGSSCRITTNGRVSYEQVLLEKLRLLLQDLIVLDDVWEMEILDRFMRLPGSHSSKFFVTCQKDPMYGSSGVSSISLGFKDVAGVTEDILAFHCGMVDREGLPVVATKLLKCCSHHPLSVSILGEALRGTWRGEEWHAVMTKLQAYLPSKNLEPVNWLAGVFGSIELSVVGMALETRSLFHSLASLSWVDPVPVDCLKAIWSVVGDKSSLLLQTRELVRRSLLKRSPDFSTYELHDIVVLYLERQIFPAVEALLKFSEPGSKAIVAPWLVHYGNAEAKEAARGALKGILLLENEELHAKVILSIVDVLSSCVDSRKEVTCKDFNCLVGPVIVDLICRATSPSTCAAIVKYISACFTDVDYETYGRGLVVASGFSNKVKLLLASANLGGNVSIFVKNDVADVLGKLAGTSDGYVVENLVKSNMVHELVQLLDAKSGSWIHDGVLTAVIKMAQNKDLTTEAILRTDLIEKMFMLLHNRKHSIRSRALNAFASLIPVASGKILSQILDHGLMEELDSLLNCQSEDVRTSASVLCQQLCSIAREWNVCMDRLLKTDIVETLTGLLSDELEKPRTCAVVSLRCLVQARGKPVAERLLRAAGLDSIHRHLMNSLCEST